MRLLLAFATLLGPALAAELPVREVVLYKHGVGYFSRAGEIAAGETARLDFQASEMNDVLKSLTVVDRYGAPVNGLRYESSEPLQKKLGNFPFQLDGQQPLVAFLDKMRGARLELKLAAETVGGAIVSARLAGGGGKDRPEIEQVVLFADSGELRTLDLAAASSLRFADAKLQDQLKEYLAALHQARSRDKRTVWIDSAGTGKRDLAISYLTPAAVWKSSYRLLFADAGPLLEGWAIVDNTSGEDWTGVRLALVSGRPVSFVSPLYEPRYVNRPVSDLGEGEPVRPLVLSGAIENLRKAEVGSADARQRGRLQAQMQANQNIVAFRDEERAANLPAEAKSTVAAPAEGRDLGELFEYRFGQPVTVKKSESAMLPFLQQKVTARKLLFYSESMGLHPMNAAEIVNSTGKTLDGGPITVLETGGYGGEALMETLKAGDKRLISYGVDLGTRVATLFDSAKQQVREIHFRRGILSVRTALQEVKTYTLRNVDAKPKTVIVEHPKRPEYQLVGMQPASTTASAWRFEVALKPASVEKFAVSEERLVEQATAFTDLTPDVLFTYLQNKALSAEGRRQLEQVAAQKQKVAALAKSEAGAEQEIRSLSEDQNRVRQNLHAMNSVSGQREAVQRYATDLATIETKLAGLRDQSSRFRRDRAAAETELQRMIEAMTF